MPDLAEIDLSLRPSAARAGCSGYEMTAIVGVSVTRLEVIWSARGSAREQRPDGLIRCYIK